MCLHSEVTCTNPFHCLSNLSYLIFDIEKKVACFFLFVLVVVSLVKLHKYFICSNAWDAKQCNTYKRTHALGNITVSCKTMSLFYIC